MSLIEQIKDIRSNPTRSYWLKNALESGLKRDCCDAATDAEVLAAILRKVADQACRAQSSVTRFNNSHRTS